MRSQNMMRMIIATVLQSLDCSYMYNIKARSNLVALSLVTSYAECYVSFDF